MSIAGNGFVFTGTGGLANGNYYLLASTNLATPLANWTPLLTNQFDINGHFSFTNPDGTNALDFYRLQLPVKYGSRALCCEGAGFLWEFSGIEPDRRANGFGEWIGVGKREVEISSPQEIA